MSSLGKYKPPVCNFDSFILFRDMTRSSIVIGRNASWNSSSESPTADDLLVPALLLKAKKQAYICLFMLIMRNKNKLHTESCKTGLCMKMHNQVLFIIITNSAPPNLIECSEVKKPLHL